MCRPLRERKGGRRSSLSVAPRLARGKKIPVLKRGKNLIWFPEGERSPSGVLQEFKPGLGMLLAHYRVPVIPAFIRGAYEALPRGRSRPHFTRIVIDFGEPAITDELIRQGEGEPPERISRGLYERLAALRDKRE